MAMAMAMAMAIMGIDLLRGADSPLFFFSLSLVSLPFPSLPIYL